VVVDSAFKVADKCSKVSASIVRPLAPKIVGIRSTDALSGLASNVCRSLGLKVYQARRLLFDLLFSLVNAVCF
jgi:hypothetical protein